MDSEPDESSDKEADSDIEAYTDAADRLERGIDHQVNIINGIDDKAEHVTRLLGILIGLIFSVLSFATQSKFLQVREPSNAAILTFLLGVLFLLVSMGSAIITYLSSRFRIGLHPSVGGYLSEPDVEIEQEMHLKRVLGSYGSILRENKQVIETNSRRFRFTLFFLLIGVLFLSTAGSIHVGGLTDFGAWIGLIVAFVLAGVSGWYIIGGKYLTLDIQESNNE